jgi:Bacterial PH domain
VQTTGVTIVRERGVAILQLVGFGLLAGFFGAGAAVPVADLVRGRGSGGAVGWVLVLGIPAVLFLASAIGSARQRVLADHDGLRIRNILTGARIAWPEIDSIVGGMTGGRDGVWWILVVALRDSDRVVKIQASATRNFQRSDALGQRLIALAPPGVTIHDKLRDPAVPMGAEAAPASHPGRRLVIRSRSITDISLAMGLWFGVAFVLAMIGIGLIVQGGPLDVAVGAAIIAATVPLMVLARRRSVTRAVVTEQGINYGRSRRHDRIPWSEITDIRLGAAINTAFTHRVEYLVVTVSNGQALPLTATTRRPAEARRILQQVRSYQAAGSLTRLVPAAAAERRYAAQPGTG